MSLIKKTGLALQKIYRKTILKLNTLKGTPESISKGFATGVAMSFTPFVGFHLILSLMITKITKQNGTAATLGTIAGNPWTFPFIWYSTLHLGYLILGNDAPKFAINFKILFSKLFHAVISLDFDSFLSDIWPEFYPMLIGCIPLYIIVWFIVSKMTIHVLSSKNKELHNDTRNRL